MLKYGPVFPRWEAVERVLPFLLVNRLDLCQHANHLHLDRLPMTLAEPLLPVSLSCSHPKKCAVTSESLFEGLAQVRPTGINPQCIRTQK